jgi:hypothetical protein
MDSSTVAWLKTSSLIYIGFGIMTALSALPAAAGLTLFLTDLVFWPLDGAQSLRAPETRLFCGITGGVVTGWGVLLWLISTRLYPREPELARTIILSSVLSWFVVDGIGSTLAGAPGNVALNVVFLLLFAVPLWRSPQGSPVRKSN